MLDVGGKVKLNVEKFKLVTLAKTDRGICNYAWNPWRTLLPVLPLLKMGADIRQYGYFKHCLGKSTHSTQSSSCASLASWERSMRSHCPLFLTVCAVELLMCRHACLVFCEMLWVLQTWILVSLDYKNSSFLKAMAQLILNLTAILHEHVCKEAVQSTLSRQKWHPTAKLPLLCPMSSMFRCINTVYSR